MKLFGGFCFFLGLFYQKVAKGELFGGSESLLRRRNYRKITEDYF